MRIPYLVGYDGSPAADAAVSLTRELAAGMPDAAVHVYPPPRPAYTNLPYPVPLPVDQQELEKIARDSAERVLTRSHASNRLVLCGNNVPHELQRLAREERAVLLAVGLTHRGLGARLVPGSVGERLVHDAPCPLLIVPPSDEEIHVRRIAVGYDGREESRRALSMASALAERTGASLLALAPLHVPAGTVESPAVEIEWRAIEDPAEESLAKVCADEGVDLLVVGSRGRGRVRGAILGSTSRHLVDHATCPLLVVSGSVPAEILHRLESAGASATTG